MMATTKRTTTTKISVAAMKRTTKRISVLSYSKLHHANQSICDVHIVLLFADPAWSPKSLDALSNRKLSVHSNVCVSACAQLCVCVCVCVCVCECESFCVTVSVCASISIKLCAHIDICARI